MWRKILSFTLMFTMCTALFPGISFGEAELSVTVNTYAPKYSALFEAANINFTPENADSVTRGEVAIATASALRMDVVSEKQIFSDVPEGTPAYNAVNLLAMEGIIAGTDNREYRPDDAVTVNEAIVIMVNAAGYKKLADAQGGYPLGYVKIASDIGITEEINFSGGVTANVFEQLIYNMLNSKVLYQTKYGINVEYKTDEDHGI